MHRVPPENRNARLAPGVGKTISNQIGWKRRDSLTLRAVQAPVFTARPRGTRWAVAAIHWRPDLGAAETVKLGVFEHRREALCAALVMAEACGGRWLQ
jgi:hypothetical protein